MIKIKVKEDAMSIGYACLTVGVPNTTMKSCRMQNVSEEKLKELISHNLNSLGNIIDYNINHDIKVFRISSDIIPFGSSPVNTLKWWELFASELAAIARKIQESGMRVSMHPGQYTVLNSPREEVVERAIEDLNYHRQLLESLGGKSKNKIILHIGGVYGDKSQAIGRFMTNYSRLSKRVKQHLVIENDDRSYTIKDVLTIGKALGIPVVFDNLHHKINPCEEEQDDLYWIKSAKETWKVYDGRQKTHYSQQDPLKQPGGHSETIGINDFIDYYQGINGEELDIMLEVKDKNLSAVKCINSTSLDQKISKLEREWGKYKYTVLEKAPGNYTAIRQLLKDKDNYPAIGFYNLVEDAMKQEYVLGNSLNGALHVWGYFKKIVTDQEKIKFLENIKMYEQGKVAISKIKNMLWKLAVKYKESYLLDSYYFVI